MLARFNIVSDLATGQRLSLPFAMVSCAFLAGIAFVSGLQNVTGTEAESFDAAASRQADCLWLVARNTGFYDVQKRAIQPGQSRKDRKLWADFVNSTGQRECGRAGNGLQPVRTALLASEAVAEAYFMNELGGAASEPVAAR